MWTRLNHVSPTKTAYASAIPERPQRSATASYMKKCNVRGWQCTNAFGILIRGGVTIKTAVITVSTLKLKLRVCLSPSYTARQWCVNEPTRMSVRQNVSTRIVHEVWAGDSHIARALRDSKQRELCQVCVCLPSALTHQISIIFLELSTNDNS
jgi:hypothetical protein